MASNWTTLRLGDVCSKIGSGATPRGGSRVYLEDGVIAFIRSQNIYNDGFHHDGVVYLTLEHASELANVEVAEHDVLLNITGDSVARACQVDKNILPARVNQHVAIIRPDPSILSPRFLRYYLVSPATQAEMLTLAGAGATRNALTKGMIESFGVPVPKDIAEQHAIAHILGTLDDKIELNRRINETLEVIARALFKSWFVDFDPVRARAEGRDPGLPPHIAGLFPDSFEDSELGEIPKGWYVYPFAETVEIIGGGTPKTSVSDYWNGEIPWFSVVDAPSVSDIWVLDTEKKITWKALEKSSTRLLPIGTTIVSARGTVGRVALVGVPMAMNQSCYGLRGIRDEFGYYTYFVTRDTVSRLKQHAHGSVFDTITRSTFDQILVPNPPSRVIQVFEALTHPLLQRVHLTLIESRALASIRDTLLPRLISGEVRVGDAERLVASVV